MCVAVPQTGKIWFAYMEINYLIILLVSQVFSPFYVRWKLRFEMLGFV